MADRYVGPGGNDGNSGLTWASRKLTLNGMEDTPVVADDVVYVGPGAYREMLTVDVSGNAGNYITYVGDMTGAHTDGVGGLVRITGSNNDQVAARSSCVTGTGRHYRRFRGFALDTTTSSVIFMSASHHWTLEDLYPIGGTANAIIRCLGDAQSDLIIRRCMFMQSRRAKYMIEFSSGGIQDANHLVQNCIFVPGEGHAVGIDDIGGIDIRNSLFVGGMFVVRVSDSPPVGYTPVNVNNCIFTHGNTALRAVALGEIVEDYNTFFCNDIDRTNVAVGGNSVTYPALLLPPLLHAGVSQVSGFKFPWWFGELSKWSQIRAITGSNEPTEDLQGIARPVTASKNSWGPLQFHDMERETSTTRGASAASLCLHDAGRHQVFLPVSNESTTISVYVYREASYTGDLPQMIIKQPGQADDITTDSAAASQWNLLTTTLTPSADTDFVVVELVSRNTATSGSYDVFFDDRAVT